MGMIDMDVFFEKIFFQHWYYDNYYEIVEKLSSKHYGKTTNCLHINPRTNKVFVEY